MSTEDKTERFPITDMGFVSNAMLNDTINAVMRHIWFNDNEVCLHAMKIVVDGFKRLFWLFKLCISPRCTIHIRRCYITPIFQCASLSQTFWAVSQVNLKLFYQITLWYKGRLINYNHPSNQKNLHGTQIHFSGIYQHWQFQMRNPLEGVTSEISCFTMMNVWYIYVYIYIYIRTHTYTHVHTYTHTHIHIRIFPLLLAVNIPRHFDKGYLIYALVVCIQFI